MNSKQFATVLVITFIVGMFWLIADIWRNTKASIPVSDKLQATLEQVNPTFNGRVLQTIQSETLSKNDIQVTTPAVPAPSEAPISDTLPAASPEPSPIAAPQPSAQPAASPSSNPGITPIITIASPSPSPISSSSPAGTLTP